MLSGQTVIFKVHEIYHRTLHIVFNINEKSYDELLVLNDDVSFHKNSCLSWVLILILQKQPPEVFSEKGRS